ncbi:hypothetical protein QVD17_11009 [Tagetes erecta]|uniref:Uncharacterized protein n=1 Tax=Tagetes erecta TaxID=13708 RepID=A0AAD8L7N2_TARER|nr:hypothetical protein QVD17_11009 [Tagetes erecta]
MYVHLSTSVCASFNTCKLTLFSHHLFTVILKNLGVFDFKVIPFFFIYIHTQSHTDRYRNRQKKKKKWVHMEC